MKKLLAILLVLATVFAMTACGGKSDEQAAEGMKSFTVTVIFQDGAEKNFTYESQEEFLGPVLMEVGLIQGKEGPYGMEITSVLGVQAIYDIDKAYWAVYEGEEYALQGVDTTPLVDGGVYKLVYTSA